MENNRLNGKKYYNILLHLFLLFLAAVFSILPGLSVNAAQHTGAQQTVAGTANTEHVTEQAGRNLILTQLTAQGRTVTLTVNIAKDSQASSGRIKIHYPGDMLRITDAQGGKLWEMEDVNTGLSETGQNVAAYAWAGTEKLTGEGNLLTVTWEAQDVANGKEIIVETEVTEVYSQEERLAVNPDWIIDRLKLNFPVGGAVRTGDDSSAAALGLLCLFSLLVMVRLVRSRLV